ncbi:hypothetical protein AO361_15840 [Pseudomonas fluorescens]|uniref:hypothetical protein n=1 Tax=Pseudomonas TaxID=286 RepID=UPI00070CF89C|nr:MULTISPECIES: hypothetical protein [Pseudomonas]OOQ44578.1 hypothetical protein AO361_15840 [Pseudomonas fluorescens]
MFRTYLHTAIPLSSRLEPDLQLWPYVEQILTLPWFYATVTRSQGDVVSKEMLLISDVLTLEHFQLGLSSGQVEDILLVSPASMNGQGRWLMEPVQEISYVPSSQLWRSHYLYVVAGGRNYTNNCDPGLEAEQSNRSRIVFSIDR